MSLDLINDQYSVKNLLFYRAIPTYVAPINADSHNLYACKDCGDKFALESSYQYHIQRKSVQIKYKCRNCLQRITFYNRCNLLSHIRSHTFKTATIDVSDLKIDPLDISFFKFANKEARNNISNTSSSEKSKHKQNVCFDCKKEIPSLGSVMKDRAHHYMEYTNKVYSCPVCLFTLPTTCGLKAHLRIHLKIAPYYCPECGIHMAHKSINYPYSHSCEGFNMMRATSRHLCPIPNCIFFHPNDYKQHMKEKHIKKIFSCPHCVVASFNDTTMKKHIQRIHKIEQEALVFYQCQMCPGRLVMQSHVESHLNNHKKSQGVYPCWICSSIFKEIPDLINHHLQNHDQSDELKKCLMNFNPMKKLFRVVKRCDQCMRNVTYKCNYEDINILPNACPYKCVPLSKSMLNKDENNETIIKCPLCKNKIDENWSNVKRHFARYHKDHRCVDAIISLPKLQNLPFKKRLSDQKKKGKLFKRHIKKGPQKDKNQQQNGEQNTENVCIISTDEDNINFNCDKCHDTFETKEGLEKHIITKHRDPCMAYQCMECGDCFVVKPSFSIHLLFHGISNVDDYIKTTKCFNENALNNSVIDINEEPLDENQCKICRERFDDADDLKKHFRVHGMAFLKKNSLDKPLLSL